MAYALWATYGHLPMKPLSTLSTPLRIRKHSFTLRNSDHFLYKGFTCLPATKPVSPVVRAVDKSANPSKDDKRGAKILKGAVGASLVLACAIGVFNCSFNLKPNAIAISPKMLIRKSTNIMKDAVKVAIKSLSEGTTKLTPNEVKQLEDFKLPPTNPSTEDIRKLKMAAVQLINSGNIDEAMDKLKNAYDDCERSSLREQTYEADMAIAELLIIQRKYKEALKRNCLAGDESQGPRTDPRFTLYKVIVHAMLDNKDEAEKWWGKYVDIIGEGFDSSGPPIVK